MPFILGFSFPLRSPATAAATGVEPARGLPAAGHHCGGGGGGGGARPQIHPHHVHQYAGHPIALLHTFRGKWPTGGFLRLRGFFHLKLFAKISQPSWIFDFFLPISVTGRVQLTAGSLPPRRLS